MASVREKWIRTVSYSGPERRRHVRRASIDIEEWGWRMFNLGLNGGDKRSSFGRRAEDLPQLQVLEAAVADPARKR